MAGIFLDVEKKTKDSEKQSLETGKDIVLSAQTKARVVMTKFIPADKAGDWQPGEYWREEVTADIITNRKRARSPKLEVAGIDGDMRALRKDDGIYVGLLGLPTRIVGLLPKHAPMSEDEVEALLDASEDLHIPMFTQWDFRVEYARYTNGPSGRDSLMRSEDQKRSDAETRMFDSFAKMMQMGMGKTMAQGNMAADADMVLAAAHKILAEKGKTLEDLEDFTYATEEDMQLNLKLAPEIEFDEAEDEDNSGLPEHLQEILAEQEDTDDN